MIITSPLATPSEIEKVAKALYACPGGQGFAKTDMIPLPWDRLPLNYQDHWRLSAVAAIGALRG